MMKTLKLIGLTAVIMFLVIAFSIVTVIWPEIAFRVIGAVILVVLSYILADAILR